MPLHDADFADLARAFGDNPQSDYLRRTLIEAADTPMRLRTLAKLFVPEAGPLAKPGHTEVQNENGSDDVSAPVSQTVSNVIELTTGFPAAPVPSEISGLADVGGLEAVKVQLRRRMLGPLLHPSLFERFKRRAGGGLLLYGPPGCGKTMVVKALAIEAQIRLIKVEAAEILDCAVGYSEKRIVAAFEEARAAKPCILFFDEVEALASRRSQGSDFKSTLVSTFLNAFDGMSARNDKVLVMGATNVPWAVDSAFRRPGRFDRTIFVPPPNLAARTAILDRLLETRPVASTVNSEEIAHATAGFSGADLNNIVETAIDLTIEDSLNTGTDQELRKRHFEQARREVRPTTLEWLTTARNYAKYANESGTYDEVLEFLDKHAA